MMKFKFISTQLFLTIIIGIMTCSLSHSQNHLASVVLEGHVYAETGDPVSGAKIDLLPLEMVISGVMPTAYSDEKGYYRMIVPALGKTRVSASKRSAGYPDTTAKLFSSRNDQAPVAMLNAASPINDVDIHLEPPDGTLDGIVVSKSNGDIIRSARITMNWADDTSVIYAENVPSSGTFQYALPDRGITITITAPGYRPWKYVSEKTKEQFVDIRPGEHLSIAAQLEPAP